MPSVQMKVSVDCVVQNRFVEMLFALGCRVAAVEDLTKPRHYLAIHCRDRAAGDRHTADILKAIHRSDKSFRRTLRLGRWRGRRLPCGGELLFWEGVRVRVERRTLH